METRIPYKRIWKELARDKSMIFMTGPRQCGKTTLANIIAESYKNNLYFNWDIQQHKTRLLENPTFFEQVERRDTSNPLIIFDEIHKFRNWKNYLKGIYDQFKDDYQFLISGSGRLDIYQKGGDSLAGRYYLFHLWPFTLSELGNQTGSMEEFMKNPLAMPTNANESLKEIWDRLAKFSGFPEPYLSNRITSYRRWSNTYSRQLVREDIRDLTGVKSVEEMETLYLLLPSKVGNPLSTPSLARDLRVAYNTVRSWLDVFERFFLTFTIPAWSARITRAIQKERKVYLWDVPRIEDPAARFENMVAIELWRAVSTWNDAGYGTFSLHFIRNKEQQEVDFLIAESHKPFLLVEAKLSEREPSVSLQKFQRALSVPAVQLINEGDTFRLLRNENQTILIATADQWLSRLPF